MAAKQTTLGLVIEAIQTRKERGGSSRAGIKNTIQAKTGKDLANHLLRKAIETGIAKKMLVKSESGAKFKIGELPKPAKKAAKKPVKKPATAAKKPAAKKAATKKAPAKTKTAAKKAKTPTKATKPKSAKLKKKTPKKPAAKKPAAKKAAPKKKAAAKKKWKSLLGLHVLHLKGYFHSHMFEKVTRNCPIY